VQYDAGMAQCDYRGRSALSIVLVNALACGVLLALGWVVPSIAHAEQVSIEVLGGERDSPEAAPALELGLRRGLQEQDVDIVDGFAAARASVLEGAVSELELLPFKRANQLLAEGWRSYLEVRASFAAARLAEARTLALSVGHLQGGQALVAEISLRLGVVKLDLKRSAEAADDFRLASALAPERVVTDAEFKPEAVAAFMAATTMAGNRFERVFSFGAGQKIWIDGAPLPAPTTRLGEGLHLVVVKAPGYRSRASLLSVSPGEVAPIRTDLEVDRAAMRVLDGRKGLSLGSIEDEARRVVSAMLLYSETDSLLLAASVWRRGAPALLGQRCSGQPARCSAIAEIGYSPGGILVAGGALWRTLASAPLRFPPTLQVDGRLVQGESRPGAAPLHARRPLWKNRWVWLGAAALTVAGTTAYLLHEPNLAKPVFTGDTCQFGGC